MMEDEEVRPAQTGRLPVLPLDTLSVADLQNYINELRVEIARAEAAIAKKDGARGFADSFFRK
jgi:uncharacterized small protein (DUF1192 family)